MTDTTAPRRATGSALPAGAGLPAATPQPVAAASPAWSPPAWMPPPVPTSNGLPPAATAPAPWTPAPWPPPPSAPPAAPSRRGPLQRAGGAVLAAVAAFFKYGLLLLKVGKFGPMVISMLVSVAIFGRLFGWTYGAGLVALILVHELGHVIAARIERVPASLPFFLGPFGALITLKAPLKDARQDAVIAIGGPLLGTAGALAVAAAATQTTGNTHALLVALAYWGFFLNLFNLTPMQPFDGGRVAGAVSIWLNVAGVAIMGGLVLLTVVAGVGVNPFVVLIFILGCITTWQRFKVRHTNPYTHVVPPRTRAFIAAAWVGLIAVTALGMSLSHRALVDAGTIDRPAVDSSQTSGGASLGQ
ncbi:MAG TPA: site-2 protease family protein [Candidatus Dormibacteraeota bacterium]